MGFWFFIKKRDDKWLNLHNKLSYSFSNIRRDIDNISKWLKYFEDHRKYHHSKIIHAHSRVDELERRLMLLENFVEELKKGDFFVNFGQLSKHKQTAVCPKRTSAHVQTPVQTVVQTGVEGSIEEMLRSLTMMERAVVWVLLNTDLKLTYDDLAAVLGKDKSTIRGQLNNIKRKSEDLISETLQKDGKKRFYIKEDLKNKIKKTVVRRVIKAKNDKK